MGPPQAAKVLKKKRVIMGRVWREADPAREREREREREERERERGGQCRGNCNERGTCDQNTGPKHGTRDQNTRPTT
jgi:hypothetical protein